MTKEALETLRANPIWATKHLIDSPDNSDWIKELVPGDIFVEKKYTIEDFDLLIPTGNNDREADISNSIILFEHLRVLPQYVLTDEAFWAWINFTKGYRTALKYMPVKEGSSVFKEHWIFSGGQRRGLFFGVLSRCYFRVAFTYDENLKDNYELSRFIIENPNRFRNLTWRTYSNNKKLVSGVLLAERDILRKYGENMEHTKHFEEIAKYISKMGSVMLLDAMDENNIYQKVYDEYEKIILRSPEYAKSQSLFGQIKKSILRN